MKVFCIAKSMSQLLLIAQDEMLFVYRVERQH